MSWTAVRAVCAEGQKSRAGWLRRADQEPAITGVPSPPSHQRRAAPGTPCDSPADRLNMSARGHGAPRDPCGDHARLPRAHAIGLRAPRAC